MFLNREHSGYCMRQTARDVGIRLAIACLSVLTWLFFASANQALAQATFTPLGVFNADRSQAQDVSADGTVVVGTTFETPPPSSHFFRWTAQGSILGPLSGDFAAVSADGTVVVGAEPGGPFGGLIAVRWNVAGDFDVLGTLPGDINSGASDVSGDGAVVVGSSSAIVPGPEAFRWTEATGMVGLGGLTGAEVWSSASGTSADGSVIVGQARDVDNSFQPFRWTAETGMVKLGLAPNGTGGFARSVTPNGSVVIGAVFFPPPQPGSTAVRREAFRWTESDGMIALGDLAGGDISSTAFAVSANGSVIVGTGETFSAEGMPTINEAFYWTPNFGMLNLRDVLVFGGANGLDGWTLTEARGVSYDGLTVAGTAIDPNGVTQAFVATVGAIPEASTIVLSALAALLIWALYLRQSFLRSTGR
jgi:probable HAF family extracellular repeat protein